ncbi:hypothetical protein GCM10012275_11270 [Longimycelium tulufanense]|uniref:Uncharacterized protein n=1 Tax=Longimycelium tulufanense TaxID=907463 RepID=A0A8J3C6M6_9PSEU|nr:hypothetical protein [Longimycelium tulufanense]GGM42054.1 hypothetical protein GCM10012275_11270 [Longimycelium tulufanense]
MTAQLTLARTPEQQIFLGTNAMLIHEALARTRMYEDHAAASQERLARQLLRTQRWRWLARYADRRANRAATGLCR